MKSNKELDSHVQRLKEKYEDTLRKHDINTPEAVHYRDMKKGTLRFKLLSEITDLNNKMILDFGCGNALFLDFLKEHVVCDYYGWDISEKMIEAAKTRYPEGNFKAINILKHDLSIYENYFDFILISGVFNGQWSSLEITHKEWIKETLLKLWPLCKGGLSVNFLTEYVDWEEDDLFYCKIDEIISFVANKLSRWFVIRHDYQLYEFTLYIYKEGKAPK